MTTDRFAKTARITAGLLLLAGAGVAASGPTKGPSRSLAAESASLRKLQAEVTSLKFQMRRLTTDEAYVSTVGDGYSIARTPFGPFVVSQAGLTEYLDGYKLKLHIGNLTAATFRGAKLQLSWGPEFDEKDVQRWVAAQKEREVEVTDTLPPGRYTAVEVILTPAKPTEVKIVAVGLTLDRISLSGP